MLESLQFSNLGEKTMASTLEIINGISQAMSNIHDGAVDEDGNPIEVGLKREEGHPINDSRVMDGFFAKVVGGNRLCVYYHGDVKIKEVHDKNFESDMESMIKDVVKFLKKEYKKITGSALSLKKDGDIEVRVESTSRIRAWVVAKCDYILGGVDSEEVSSESESKLEDSVKKWLELSSKKKPQNVTRKKDSHDHFDPTNLKSGIRK